MWFVVIGIQEICALLASFNLRAAYDEGTGADLLN